MAPVSILPKVFRWFFTVLVVLAALCAVGIVSVMLVDPKLPPGTHFGPKTIEFAGQPGSVELRAAGSDSDFTVTALRGSVKVFVAKAGGLIEVIKHHGLPVMLLNAAFFATLFELLRRLFRNVGRGESFTLQSVRLVQILGFTLIVYSLVSAMAENWFARAAYDYLVQNATLTISGTSLHLPSPHNLAPPHFSGFPFGSPWFFSGLLVLALSEVFRQGLVIKSENDLTV
jgi:hypothetical protein